jgi:hypothetical protein
MTNSKPRLIAGLVATVLAIAVAVTVVLTSGGDSTSPVVAAPVATEITTSTGLPLPLGPEIDFCPTVEQSKEHYDRYGFDYELTVHCTAEGGIASKAYVAMLDKRDAALPKKQLRDKRRAELMSATRIPDPDGDPTSIECARQGGKDTLLMKMLGDPERFRGLTCRELADILEPPR